MTYDLVKRTILLLLGLWIVMVVVGYASAKSPANVHGTLNVKGSEITGLLSGTEISLRRVQ